MSNIGTRIKQLRMNLDLTLEALAERIGASKSYIWDIENGKLPRPSAEKVFALARALHVTMEELVNDEFTNELNDLIESSTFIRYPLLSNENKKTINNLVDVWTKNPNPPITER